MIWLLGCLVLTLGAAVPAAWLASRGRALERLVGLQQLGAVTVLILLLFTQSTGDFSYLAVPLVLVLLSFAGGLVFVRLLGPRR